MATMSPRPAPQATVLPAEKCWGAGGGTEGTSFQIVALPRLPWPGVGRVCFTPWPVLGPCRGRKPQDRRPETLNREATRGTSKTKGGKDFKTLTAWDSTSHTGVLGLSPSPLPVLASRLRAPLGVSGEVPASAGAGIWGVNQQAGDTVQGLLNSSLK